MNNSKQSIKRIFYIIMVMFVLLSGSVLKIAVLDSRTIISNPYNPRLNVADNTIKRGDIKDINGTVMAYSEKSGEEYQRYYVNGTNAAHVLGYYAPGKSGIEATENFTLQKLNNETFQRIRAFMGEDDVEGNTVVLTVDAYLQQLATDLMGSNKGAVVVMEVKTGRIAAMVSKPNYNPQNVADNWSSLRQDPDSALLNRAAQGKYTPGSIFKIVTAVTALRHMEDAQNFTYECKGTAYYEDKVINCANKTVHGQVNLKSAFAKSCNCYFAELAAKLGNERLIAVSEELGFNRETAFELTTSTSTVMLQSDGTESELVETSIGQGRTTVTPLFMAKLVGAIANGGNVMHPYLVDHIESYSGRTLQTNLPSVEGTLFSRNESEILTDMMIEVINNGTGYNANSEYFQVAGKTGTAQNPNGSDHLWFVGFAPADDPQYAVAVVLENANGSVNANVVARKMLYNAIYREDN